MKKIGDSMARLCCLLTSDIKIGDFTAYLCALFGKRLKLSSPVLLLQLLLIENVHGASCKYFLYDGVPYQC